MVRWLVIYERFPESLNVEVEAENEACAIKNADRLLRILGENPNSFKRPRFGKNRINTVRPIETA